MKENLLSISYHLGCQLEVEFSEKKILSEGNNCKKKAWNMRKKRYFTLRE